MIQIQNNLKLAVLLILPFTSFFTCF